MGDRTKIEWTDATWNPVRATSGRWHCTKVSEGCANCYAERLNVRFGGPRYVHGADLITIDESALLQPLRWRRPRRVFVCSMTDLFHEGLTDSQICGVFAVIALAGQHTFQVLTKRAERMRLLLCDPETPRLVRRLASFQLGKEFTCPWPLPNVWLGVSAENQDRANERIPELLETPADVRFVSCEPLLGPVDLREYIGYASYSGNIPGRCVDIDGMSLHSEKKCGTCGWGYPNDPDLPGRVPGLDWVIAGGESGPGARPMHPDWARSLRDQCAAAGVAFHFKQWGEWAPWDFNSWNANDYPLHTFDDGGEGEMVYRVGKKKAGRMLDCITYDEYPRETDTACPAGRQLPIVLTQQ